MSSCRMFLLAMLLLPSLAMASWCAVDQQDPQQTDSTKTKEVAVSAKSPSGYSGVVEVVFKITDDGKAEVVDIRSTTPMLQEYVLQKLKKVQLDSAQAKPGQTIRYRFVFQEEI